MSERLSPAYQTISREEWSSPQRREKFEAYLGTPLGAYVYEFSGTQGSYLHGAYTVGEGVIKQMSRERDPQQDSGFKVVCLDHFNNPDGTFSKGHLFFGAPSRELAEQFQDRFTQEMNVVLDSIDAGFRLAEPNYS